MTRADYHPDVLAQARRVAADATDRRLREDLRVVPVHVQHGEDAGMLAPFTLQPHEWTPDDRALVTIVADIWLANAGRRQQARMTR